MRSIVNDITSTYDALILEIANMPTLHNRRVQDMCILIYKAIHGTTSTPLSTLLMLRSNTRNLRGELKLAQPRVNTTKYDLNTFRYYGPKIWNSLTDKLRTSPSIKKKNITTIIVAPNSSDRLFISSFYFHFCYHVNSFCNYLISFLAM